MFEREREKKSTGFRSELLPGKGGKTVIRCGCEKVWLCEVWRMLCVSKLCWCSWALGADDGSWVEPRLLSDSGWEPAAAAGLELVDWPFFRQRPKAALICCCSPVMLLISPVETNQTVTTIHLAWHVSSFLLSSLPPSPPPRFQRTRIESGDTITAPQVGIWIRPLWKRKSQATACLQVDWCNKTDKQVWFCFFFLGKTNAQITQSIIQANAIIANWISPISSDSVCPFNDQISGRKLPQY